MSAKIIFGILLAGLLSNNYAVLQFLGTGTVMQNHRPVRQSLVLGLGTTVVMILGTLITWPINTYLLANASCLRDMLSWSCSTSSQSRCLTPSAMRTSCATASAAPSLLCVSRTRRSALAKQFSPRLPSVSASRSP